MIPQEYIWAFLAGVSLGVALGLICARQPRKHLNYEPEYFKGNGDPQPGKWTPGHALGNGVKVYGSLAERAREMGAV